MLSEAAIDPVERTIGELPEGWKSVAIGRVGRVMTGGTPPLGKSELWGDSIPFVTPGDICDGKDKIDSAARQLSEFSRGAVPIVPQGTVLVTCIGATIGKAGISTRECGFNQQINAVVAHDNNDAHYIYSAICAQRPRLLALSGNQAVPIINKSTFSKIRIPLPPPPRTAQDCGDFGVGG